MDSFIEAQNIRGLGSMAVCKELIPALVEELAQRGNQIRLNLSSELAAKLTLSKPIGQRLKIVSIKKSLLGEFTRLLAYFINRSFKPKDLLIVLGDLPYRTNSHQIVFVQQANLLTPHVETNVNTGFKFRLMRFIFSRNHRFVKKFIVQTEYMKANLIKSYGIDPEKIVVIRHVMPASGIVLKNHIIQETRSENEKHFFYPASFYAYKNHALLWRSVPLLAAAKLKIKILLTLKPDIAPFELRESPYLSFLGTLSQEECARVYQNSDALIFPSKLESYGLPLLESLLVMKKPVLAADRLFSRELCRDIGRYFDPDDPNDLVAKIKDMLKDFPIITDSTLKQLPQLVSWETMAKEFVSDLLGNAEFSRHLERSEGSR
jgi:glycosyltransferase involved in cell wall biosynthesis